MRLSSVSFLFEKLISLRMFSTLTCSEGSEVSDCGVLSESTGRSPAGRAIYTYDALGRLAGVELVF